jgi:hypothetical protein
MYVMGDKNTPGAGAKSFPYAYIDSSISISSLFLPVQME